MWLSSIEMMAGNLFDNMQRCLEASINKTPKNTRFANRIFNDINLISCNDSRHRKLKTGLIYNEIIQYLV